MAAKNAKCTNVAVIFGVTGLVGKELAGRLLSRGWKVYGVARRPDSSTAIINKHQGYNFMSCDILDSREAQDKLSPINDVTHIFWVTWASQFPLDSPECYDQNKTMMANALIALLPKAERLRHVSLQTGVKHYVSLQELLDKGVGCYDERSPRVIAGHNFYYGLEDLLQEMLPLYKVAWSIHRPGFIIGSSRRTYYDLIGSICVYGTICKYLNLPFVFGGTKKCWEEMYIDTSDARLVADQQIFVATGHEQAVEGRAYNAINGEYYIWKEIWPAIGAKLGAEAPENGAFSGDFVYSLAMGGKEGVWKEIVAKEGLVVTEMKELANWDLLDQMFRCPAKMLCTRNKIDLIGFKSRYHVLDSIIYWIDVMRADKLIP
ncbi:Rossmann-fold superfamily protein [Perilla frutescens var. frutescens]|nr:Rossmann-fold superfamily protein [Perilla frutescens var. frutescens]